MADQLNLVVHPFQGTVGGAQPVQARTPVEMCAEQANKSLEGIQAGASPRRCRCCSARVGWRQTQKSWKASFK
jgi:hypothetical protein